MIIVIDTNVFVSGLLKETGSPAVIVNHLLTGRLKAAYDLRIISEYREVLKRPKFSFKPVEIDALLNYIEAEGVLVYPDSLALALPDTTDLPFLEVACSIDSKILVTGNNRHFPESISQQAKILSPAELLRTCKNE